VIFDQNRAEGVGAEELCDPLGVKWPGMEEPLTLVALLVLQLGELGVVLDALGEGLEVEGLAQSDQRLEQCGTPRSWELPR
jgi:hypothetical protein